MNARSYLRENNKPTPPENLSCYQKSDSSSSDLTVDWGKTRYKSAFDRQLICVDERIEEKRADTLIFTEHFPVYTIGRHKNSEQHLKWGKAMLEQSGIEVETTNRGGDITYHGPGQIVGYPIISLVHRKDLHRYLRDLEEALIRTLSHFGLIGERREGMTGIWIEKRKIAAIGIAVKQWTTYHGFALNVHPTLEHFGGIVPCGITDGTVTSMENELSYKPDIKMLKHLLEVEFWGIFTNYALPC